MRYPGSVRGLGRTWARPDRRHQGWAQGRWDTTWQCKGRGPALALVLLAVVAALLGGPPLLAAVTPTSDLVVTMTAAPLSVPVGGQIAYRMAVTNQGPDLAPNVVLIDSLPPGLQFVSATTSQGHSFLSGRSLVCELGVLDVARTAVVTLLVRATVAGVYTNGASVRSDNPDPNLDNNVASYPASAGPQPPPVSPCAVDQTRATRVIPSRIIGFDPRTRRYFQQVQVGNISRQPIIGPVWLVLDALAPIVLTNADGLTRCQAPLGSPYIQINVGSDRVLRPNEVATATLSFAVPAGRGLTYRTRVLTGVGER
jgi:uncharacterized repeat protein (TIGR01451 family)